MAKGQVVSFHQLKIKKKKNNQNKIDCMGSISCQAKNGDIAFIVSGTNPCFCNAIPPVLQVMLKISQVNTSTR